MNNVPTTINGVPLTELIGKEVTVKFLSGQMPFPKSMIQQLQRKTSIEILFDIQFNSLKKDYQLRILMMSTKGKIISCYPCLYSNIELTVIEGGKIVDVNTPDMQSLLETINKSKLYSI